MLDAVEELAPSISARAAEIEAGRRIPPDLIATLRRIGIFRMAAPRSHGGLEFDLRTAGKVIAALSRIDGSVGWIATIAAGCSVYASLFSAELYDRIYGHGPDVIFAGAVAPFGTAERVGDHWRVSGRWPFASGCQHADWIFAGCVIVENGKPLPGPAEAMPLTRMIVLEAPRWRIEDTWRVSGLKGTGSHHIALSGESVPVQNVMDLGGVPCLPGPLYAAPRNVIPLFHNPVSLGIARAALDDLIALAHSGRTQPQADTPMANAEIFRYGLGRVEADLKAAEALSESITTMFWDRALAGTLDDAALFIEGRQIATWIIDACVRVVDGCFAFGGGSSLYETSPLQRRMRDLHAAARHFMVQRQSYQEAGKRLLERDLPLPERRGATARDFFTDRLF
jgi:alkylation response protein AidB-like acyl-CoA dehydrogenase